MSQYLMCLITSLLLLTRPLRRANNIKTFGIQLQYRLIHGVHKSRGPGPLIYVSHLELASRQHSDAQSFEKFVHPWANTKMTTTVFKDVTPCSLIEVHWHFIIGIRHGQCNSIRCFVRTLNLISLKHEYTQSTCASMQREQRIIQGLSFTATLSTAALLHAKHAPDQILRNSCGAKDRVRDCTALSR